MDTTNRGGFSRVSVLTRHLRVDVALPSDVAVADLMSSLFDLTRVAVGDGGAQPTGWCLSRIGEPELDLSKSLAALEVMDGELLHLRPRRDSPPPPVYDDVADAIASASAESSRRWDGRLKHHLGLVVAVVGLVLTAGALWRLPDGGAAVPPALGLAVLLVAVAASVARAGGDLPTAVVLGAGALPAAAVAGVRTVHGAPDQHAYLLASTALLVASVLALVALGAGAAVFATGATVGLLGGIACLTATLIPAPGRAVAAGLLVLACAGLAVVPRLAIRFAALPGPVLPGRAGDDTLEPDPDFDEIGRRSRVAQDYLTGMYAGTALTLGGSAVFLATAGGWAVLLAMAGLAVLLLRARGLTRTPHVLAILLPGLTAGLLTLVLSAAALPPERAGWHPVGAAALVVIAIAAGVVLPQRRFAPTTHRLVDALEALLIAALVPLALAVTDLYRVLRQL